MTSMLLVAHGSRDPRAARTCQAIRDHVAELKPTAAVGISYLEHGAPPPADALGRLPQGPVVLVPLLLAAAYHVHVDIAGVAAAARAAGRDVRVARPLAPDALLLDVAADRLVEAGVPAGAAVVLASAGTSDEAANAVTRAVAADLAARRGAPVEAAFASAAEPAVPQAIAHLQAENREVAVLSWLLAPGRFADTIAADGRAAGVRATQVLGEHPAIARVLIARFDAAS